MADAGSATLSILMRAQGAAQTAGQVKSVNSAVASLGSRASGLASTLKNNVGGALSTFGGRVRGLVTGPLAMLTGAAGIYGVEQAFTASIGAAKDFGAAMELIHTQAGASQGEVASMSAALLKMSTVVGTTPEVLAAGLYHVESAGLRGAKALEILQVAAEGAKVGNADLESVTNALVAANQSGIKGVQDMASAMGTLNAIVGSGNMRMQDLTDAMGTGVLSTAKNYGVTIQSVGAALASMTDQGIPAVDAATRLNSAMRLMAAPVSQAGKLLKSIGLSKYQLAADMRSPGGILTAITDLKKHLDKSGLSLTQQAALIANAFGGKQSGAILTLIGNVDLLAQKTASVAKGASGFGEAWAATQNQSEMSFDKFGAAIGMLQITVGAKLLPMVTDGLTSLTGFITDNADAIAGGIAGVADFAKTAAGTIGNLVGAAAAFWSGIPGPLRDLLTKGIIADRAISFFFGISPIKVVASLATSALGGVVGGLGKAVGGALAGAGLGKLFVQPVFVTNPGFGGPGGGGGSPIATAGEGAAGAGAAETLGASALGLANLVAGIAAPIIMFDLIPKLFPGPTQNGAGAGSQPAMLTSTGTLSSQQVAMMTGLMPSFQKFVVANGGIPLGGHQEPLVRLAPGDLQELRADARAADSRENRVAAEMAGLTSRQDTANARLQQIAERRYSNHLDVTIPITAIVTATISARSAVRAQTTSRIYGSGSSRTYME